RIRMGTLPKLALAVGALAAVVAVAYAGGGLSNDAQASAMGQSADQLVPAEAVAAGQPPPEWAANAGAWPAHNYDLANTRATTQTPIDSQSVAQLQEKWRFAFKGSSGFGAFASTPISVDGTVYLQDLNSNVYALDRTTGKVKWQHKFGKASVGPNGVAFGWGRIYGATSTEAFALDPQTGKLLWSRRLVRNKNEGVDMTPQ